MIDVNTTLDILFLNQDFAKDCKCQSAHDYVPVCSQTVTHLVNGSCEDRPVLICQNVAIEHYRFMSLNGTCSGCGRLASECWSIRPI